MNHHLKPVVTAIGAIAFVLPFTLADFAWSQAPTNRQIAVEPSAEKKPADAAAKKDVPAKKAEEAIVSPKQPVPAAPEKVEAKKEDAPSESDKVEVKKDEAPAATDKAEAKKEDAPAASDKAEAKKEGAPAEPGKAAAKKEAPPEKLSKKDIALALQTELKRVGCYYGALDGIWGRRSINALHAFGYFGKIKTNNFNPSETWIGRVKGKSKTVCKGNYGYGGPPPGYGPGYGGPGYGGPPPGGYQGGYGRGGYGRY